MQRVKASGQIMAGGFCYDTDPDLYKFRFKIDSFMEVFLKLSVVKKDIIR